MNMTVTGIEPYPKGKGRVAVYLNDRFAFVLYKGELSQYGLDTGSLVDDELYERILNETLIPRAKKRGMNLLMKMDRTESDIRRKLSEGGYPDEAVDAATEYLRSFKYIDDSRYAGEYIRCNSASKSRKQIIMKLSEKGIAKDVIEEAFAAYEEEFGESASDTQNALIRKLIMKRCPLGVEDIDYETKQKLFAYMYGKGFSVSDVEHVIEEMRSLTT